MTVIWWSLGILVVAGATCAVVLAALEYWAAFTLFLVVYVIGVTALTVQVVLTT